MLRKTCGLVHFLCLFYAAATFAGTPIFGTPGDDNIQGQADDDAFIATHLPSLYGYSSGVLSGPEGNDSLTDVEFIGFGYMLAEIIIETDVRPEDLSDPDGTAGPEVSPVTNLLRQITDLYVAYFKRAPDEAGLIYWFREIYTGVFVLADTARSFTDQPEYFETYPPELTDREFIRRIYENLFNREPDLAGWDFWENELQNGMPRDTFILSVINGALAPTGGANDRALINNKHDVALYYTEQISLNPDEGFDDNISLVLAEVSHDPDTVPSAKNAIDQAMNTAQTISDIVADPNWWDNFKPENDSPVANAGSDQETTENLTVSLNGSGTDSDGEIVGYAWTQTGGPAVTLQNTNQANAIFMAPEVNSTTALNFQLTVTDDEGATDSDSVTVTVADDTPAAPTLSQIQSEIFNVSCAFSGCHAGAGPAAGLSLSSGQAFSNLVEVPSSQNPSLTRVVPGDADNSLLVQKVEGTAPIGSRMPLGAAPLGNSLIQMIRDWINAGALNDNAGT